MNVWELDALDLGERIKKREVGVAEAANALLDRIESTDPALHAYVATFRESANAQAQMVQKKVDAGEGHGPLFGVPVAVKDNICVKGMTTTCGSRMLYNFCPPYNATVTDCLEQAGAVVVGKLNMDEFAMGSTTETSYAGICKNPWDPSRVPGGSSGGAAAAVAASEAFYTLGTDTGGSIRQPASFCGVTGIKPTYGTVSRYGVVAYASSLDQVGTLGRDAATVAASLDIITKKDPKDSTSVEHPDGGFYEGLTGDVKGLRIGIPTDYFGEGLDPQVKEKVLAAAKELERLGAMVEQFPMPLVEYVVPAYYIISSAEASSNLSRYDGVKYGFRAENYEDLYDLYLKSRSQGFGMEVKRRIMLGNFVLSSGYYDAYYNKALKVRALIKQAFDKAFRKYDMLLGPVAPTTALKLGENLDDPLKMYLGDIYTVSVNLAGLPGLSAPCGFDGQGLPIGMQLIGPAFGEKTLLNAAHAYQQVTDFHRKKPQ
ncbi:Asp-tRNA(Asn)/Glu-tRNA(Gln) amidotransferase subunit GatA [Solibaculum mannosilyticum]|uniref:Glutamyl-tRNA(Gln) amidotransferase subunit A n=1 Tax=Solibaculum mannosilyticum TaxID=2780922 RepID=A0A7I8CZX1_9FIRM|nr:Asp-tRNA(Asn)/Glu-tRNA(Gln) amidotransferase subunit GatA [Solibaculum mannosilyticum]BCI60047.1 glutamyl-tRNA(Gln) amidotransferase subunit A [Solibaculum mannosilyticum]